MSDFLRRFLVNLRGYLGVLIFMVPLIVSLVLPWAPWVGLTVAMVYLIFAGAAYDTWRGRGKRADDAS